MRIETFSVLAGSTACNARCPFCVSKMTPECGMDTRRSEVNWRNFTKACLLAKQAGVTTVMLTGKGEPTLDPRQISEYLEAMRRFEFPLIELQTNGIAIADKPVSYEPHLENWYKLGLNTIALSVVHYSNEENRKIYLPHRNAYIDLPQLIDLLHGYGFSVRLSCIMVRGLIDSPQMVREMIDFSKDRKVDQISFIPVNEPAKFSDDNDEGRAAWEWTKANHVTETNFAAVKKWVEENGAHLLTLAHGAKVFDIGGQCVCLNHCLDVVPNASELRNLIFFRDGSLRYYWQHAGATLLNGWQPR